MSHVSLSHNGANAEFTMGERLSIAFSDPSYARATSILLNLESNTVHAVLHEGVFLIGEAPVDFCEQLKGMEEIALCASLSSGDAISLTASVGVVMSANDHDMEAIGGMDGDINAEGLMPAVSSGGFAMTPIIR